MIKFNQIAIVFPLISDKLLVAQCLTKYFAITVKCQIISYVTFCIVGCFRIFFSVAGKVV